ncbi:YafY family transcriptional regulator [Pseudoclavibacter chungangensis]|uniref:YafY family transcriptional regulator n=1 Tax=Pseudoclavibacter chungangensis TaxID=587635 RepID=A0A7J5BP70_9MICO|nr:YafY family protein [Pseudoclavibacter chungangensis]KAB1654564.1 YafY family transcriptional regulator [Pseudoclavibacter chungangensis]NYJ68199.1 putative DNA-binding transcriptional regulator YafY [Pseudoclavibacter chungangensis]
MSDTTTRALELLNLLQTHRHWLGPELAERLGVTERTVRRDVERLRTLGYRIESSSGATGGYRLEAGSALPPLLLNDEEAVAMAVGLRLAAAQRLLAGPDTTLTALAKLEQVLPGPLRRRVNALTSTMHPVATGQGAPVSPDVLGDLALACRDHERIRFDYTAADGADTRRFVEPHLLAPARRNWYLIAWDLDRGAWRTLRVDRIGTLDRTRTTFSPRPLSEDEAEELILIATSMYRQRVEAEVVMSLPLDDVVAHFGAWAEGASAEDEAHTRWPLGGADWREALYGMLYVPEGVEFTTDLPEPHRAAMRESLVRVLRALDAAPPEPRADGADDAGPVRTVDG